MKLLFVARTYPPLVGGMEKFASDFYHNYQKVGDIDLLANTGGRKAIIPFFVKASFAMIFNSRKYDVIHLYDAVLFPLIPLIRLFSNAKISFTVNGLDVVYSRFGYQRLMPFFLRKADKIIAISRYTLEQCEIRGIPKEKLVAIPIGATINKPDSCSELRKSKLIEKYKFPVAGKRILLTVGRLVRRKGHYWFVANVFKNLPANFVYLIVGLGPERETLVELIHQLGIADRVFLLGEVSEEEKNCLYQISDLFVMPNIRVENDQEGFGIVLLEAGMYKLPVIASNIEGIRDVVVDGRTGRLVEEKDAQGFVDSIMNFDPDRSSIPSFLDSFCWEEVVKRYDEQFKKLTS